MTISDIIRNEITNLLNRECTNDDIVIFMRDIRDTIDCKISCGEPLYFADIETAMLNCRNDNYYRCPECWEWHTKENWNECAEMCLNCHQYDDPDYERNVYKGY